MTHDTREETFLTPTRTMGSSGTTKRGVLGAKHITCAGCWWVMKPMVIGQLLKLLKLKNDKKMTQTIESHQMRSEIWFQPLYFWEPLMNATCPPKTLQSSRPRPRDATWCYMMPHDAAWCRMPPNSPETSFLLPTSEGAHSTKSSPLPILVGEPSLFTHLQNKLWWLQLAILSVHAKTLNLQPTFFAEDISTCPKGFWWLLIACKAHCFQCCPLPSQPRET